MSVILLFLAVIAVIAGWWLSQQRLTAKPWLEASLINDLTSGGGSSLPAAKIGLGVFLAVVGCLFALLVSAYFMRMDAAATNGADWRPLPTPKLLWLNTAVLVVSSLALQWAQISVQRSQMDAARHGLLLGAVSALAFLAGQLLVWRQLAAAGYFATTNPANAFFYLITGIHGLHVAGGLVALGNTIVKVWHGVAIARLRLSVGLCTAYWHFLLLVWLIIFVSLTGWADDFVVICRALVA